MILRKSSCHQPGHLYIRDDHANCCSPRRSNLPGRLLLYALICSLSEPRKHFAQLLRRNDENRLSPAPGVAVQEFLSYPVVTFLFIPLFRSHCRAMLLIGVSQDRFLVE